MYFYIITGTECVSLKNTYYIKPSYFKGVTKSLIDSQVAVERKAGPTQKETDNSVGYVAGFVFGKRL